VFIPRATERQHIGNEIDAAMIFARADFDSTKSSRIAGDCAPLYKMRSSLLLLAGLIFSSVAKGDGWELHAAPKGDAQVAICTVTGTGPEGPAKATLLIHHARGVPLKIIKKRDVTELPIVIELCVHNFASVRGFDFDKFEGPDAPARNKPLVSVAIEAANEHFAKKFGQSGSQNSLRWLLPETKIDASSLNDSADFTFVVGDPMMRLKDFITITDLLQKSPSKIEVTVTDFTNPKRTLHFNFATDNVSEVIGKLMK
jgi:hypothetical protein